MKETGNFENNNEEIDSGVIEKAREWMKEHSKAIILSAALLAGGGAAGMYGEKKYLDDSSKVKIEEVLAGDQKINSAELKEEMVEKNDKGITIKSGIKMGFGEDVAVVTVYDGEGNLLELKLGKGGASMHIDTDDKTP